MTTGVGPDLIITVGPNGVVIPNGPDSVLSLAGPVGEFAQ